MEINLLFTGLPVRYSRGYLGWSTVTLVRTDELTLLFDTAGFNERLVMKDRLCAAGLRADQIDHDRPFRCDNNGSIAYEGAASVDLVAHFSPHATTRNVLSIRIDDEKLCP